MLTRKQHELLMFIQQRIQDTGVSPSFDEMKEALSLKSKSGIHRLITALEERGFIRRLPHRARALEVVRLPETSAAPRSRGFSPTVIAGDRSAVRLPTRVMDVVADAEVGQVPLLGKIAAGVPIAAISTVSRHVGVPAMMLAAGGEHFALEVAGDSMIDVGIYDGDVVIIRTTEIAESGDIVVALIDDEEATLKRLRRKGNTIALEAANPNYRTQIYGPDQVKIQGRMVGLLRQY